MTDLQQNLDRLEVRIAQACRAAGRAREEVELMAVSKTFPAEAILEAVSLGLTLFGENRVQEFAGKAAALKREEGRPIRSPHSGERAGDHAASPSSIGVYLIGHLQSNKAQRAAELFDGIDSLDSLRLAERLNQAAGQLGKRLPVLLEVKLSPEESKEGLDPESVEAVQLLDRLPDLTQLDAQGLMTIAPWGAPEDATRACFRSLRAWRDRWAAAHPRLNLPVLSMGMSGDFELAIAEGATRIRVGTALFGKRDPNVIRTATEADSAEPA